MENAPTGGPNGLLKLEFVTLEIAALFFALAALASLFFWFSRKEPIGKASWGLMLVGTIILTVSLVIRWINVGHIPYVQLYETFLFSAWALGVIAIIADQTAKTRLPGTISSILITLIMAYILQWSESSRQGSALVPALQSPWLDVHIATAFLSYAGFAISAGAALVYLFSPKESIDELSYRLVAFAFPLLGLAIILGAVWANQVWGTYWSWDPKETASLVTWLVYAGYLHTRLVFRWKGARASIFNLIGFACVLFTWIGLNLLSRYISSIHTYTGT
jgi:ABC-type transport system involved in cytochrome c biogenesis permease subunit